MVTLEFYVLLNGILLNLAPKSQSVFNKNSSSTLIEVYFPSQNVSGHRGMLDVRAGWDDVMTLHIDPVHSISEDQTPAQTYYR